MANENVRRRPLWSAVFDACLAAGTPTVQVLARGLPASVPLRVQAAIDAGRLLMITPGGMLACLLADVPDDKPVVVLQYD